MQFTVTQQNLNRGLSIVGHAVPSRPTQPIQAYILATIDSKQVRLSARQEDIGIHCWIPASQCDEQGMTLLPAKLLSDVVGNLPPASVVVTSPSVTDPMSCNIRCLRISANMKNAAEDPAEFPAIPSYADGGDLLLHLDTELLKQIIAEVAFASADKAALLPGLIGMNIAIGDGKAVFAAADSFRLAMRTILIPDAHLRQTLLLPARTMEELAKILPFEGTVDMLLTEDQHQVVFHTGTVDLSTRLLSAPFPSLTNGALPSEWSTRATLPTQELAALVRLMMPFAREGKNFIRLKLYGETGESLRLDREPNTVQLEVVAQDIGENHNVINAQIEGPDQEIDLHVKYLSDVLSVITTTQITLEVSHRQRPVVIRPVGGDDYLYVMMPVNFDHDTRDHAAIPSSNGRYASAPSQS